MKSMHKVFPMNRKQNEIWCSCNIYEYKAKRNVCLNTHKKSMYKGLADCWCQSIQNTDDPIQYPYIDDLYDIILNRYLDFKNLDKSRKSTYNLKYLYKI